ncbi:hypothetical protein ABPG75_004915 [Micractinium tetrahymenae]
MWGRRGMSDKVKILCPVAEIDAIPATAPAQHAVIMPLVAAAQPSKALRFTADHPYSRRMAALLPSLLRARLQPVANFLPLPASRLSARARRNASSVRAAAIDQAGAMALDAAGRQRARAAVLGALLADAATMPLHWICGPPRSPCSPLPLIAWWTRALCCVAASFGAACDALHRS